MALEDFEKQLAKEKRAEEEAAEKSQRKHREQRHHHKSGRDEDEDGGHRHKRRRRSREDEEREHRRHKHRSGSHERERDRDKEKKHKHRSKSPRDRREKDKSPIVANEQVPTANELKRDAWMEAPAALDVDYVQRKPGPKPVTIQSKKADFELKIHENEMNKHHLEELRDGKANAEDKMQEPTQHEVDYTFGDSGAQWRMMKLKGVYRKAEESGESLESVALKQYGDLRSFDDAREEEIEIDRRETYGADYVGKEKPSGELYQERKLEAGVHREKTLAAEIIESEPKITSMETAEPSKRTMLMDQTALNKLRAKMMKAKLRGLPDAAALEAEYNAASESFSSGYPPNVVVLDTMQNRMLAGGRQGEVKSVDNKRGRERGLVEENEDMSIEDMVREERRTRGQVGGEGNRFAERIAKDAKFDNDLDYMDENASKLARRVHKSEINLKNAAVADFRKMNKILDNCPLCHHEDTSTPPVAPIISLATGVYMTLPTEPEISSGGGAVIVPIQHRTNLLECDDDEWEEIRNFMKSLTRMYDAHSLGVIFYENAAHPHLHQHAALNVVPLPKKVAPQAPGFFRQEILGADAEWSQHKKLIDTLARAEEGWGRRAFRRSLAKEMPYFHVWFTLDGGLGHIVEDAGKWPRRDGFAREVLGGMLGKGVDVVRARGKWVRGDRRVEEFRKKWEKWDWTKMLVEG